MHGLLLQALLRVLKRKGPAAQPSLLAVEDPERLVAIADIEVPNSMGADLTKEAAVHGAPISLFTTNMRRR